MTVTTSLVALKIRTCWTSAPPLNIVHAEAHDANNNLQGDDVSTARKTLNRDDNVNREKGGLVLHVKQPKACRPCQRSSKVSHVYARGTDRCFLMVLKPNEDTSNASRDRLAS